MVNDTTSFIFPIVFFIAACGFFGYKAVKTSGDNRIHMVLLTIMFFLSAISLSNLVYRSIFL